MLIRKETTGDAERISEITLAAFQDVAVSNQTEHFIVKALRESGALAVSLVAEENGIVIGHVAFSPVEIADGTQNWYGLGPVSVLPEKQRKGVGKALIHAGLTELKKHGGRGCVLVGDPAYYGRFGFKNYPELIFEGVPAEFFMALPFYDSIPEGKVVFDEGFWATG